MTGNGHGCTWGTISDFFPENHKILGPKTSHKAEIQTHDLPDIKKECLQIYYDTQLCITDLGSASFFKAEYTSCSVLLKALRGTWESLC